ncbi:uncharacterized protein LOC143193946 [Rhynchophorus ferrugineus]|uniref:Protamine n=1 Tax=Rhynchophorus ferrugineus TaxID=354439 RepID=A0A834HQB7_RHYFE|nr:hypothetical protein GWI33_020923 [Rhynchophorus ferrugineus]
MARSRSRSGCRRLVSYCGGKGGKRRRSRSRRRSRGRRRCGSKRRHRSRRGRRSRRSRKRCARPGPKTKNPFLNYLRVFRKKHCKWPQYKIAIEGAKCWCKMSNKDRQQFYKQACSMQKRKGRRGRKGRGRRRGKRRRRSRRGRSRKRAGGCL